MKSGRTIQAPAGAQEAGQSAGIPLPGLPEVLPPGEVILWQGSPHWLRLARSAFRIAPVAAYFALLALLRAASLLADGAAAGETAGIVVWFVPLALAAIGLLVFLAWLQSRATTWTITNHRLVLRTGVALPMSMNIPYSRIASAGLRVHRDGSGDITVSLMPGERIPYWALWPHARPFRFSRPEPMLRGIPKAAEVARILGEALAATAGGREAAGDVTVPGWASPVPGRSRADAAV
jgi:hypothetical protein